MGQGCWRTTILHTSRLTMALLPSPSETNSLGMHFVRIRAGDYVRGSPADDPNADPNERPQQRVRLTRPFEMAVYEVTVGQFRKFADETGHQTEC